MIFHRASLMFLYLVTILMVGYLLIDAGGYYFQHESDRPLNSLHEFYKPSGFIGHGLGIIGSLLMIILLLYSIRKRFRFAQKWGNIRYWLNYHIWMGVMGPVMVLFHTSYKFGGIVAISFWSMVGVALSGVVGRYIYIQIPRSREGQQISASELEEMDTSMMNKLVEYGVGENVLRNLQGEGEKKGKAGWGALIKWLEEDLAMPFQLARIRKALIAEGKISKDEIHDAIKLLKQKLVLRRRIRFLQTAEGLLHYWHIIHKPFAVVMLVIMVVHVVVAVLFGATWIWK